MKVVTLRGAPVSLRTGIIVSERIDKRTMEFIRIHLSGDSQVIGIPEATKE